MLVGRKSSPPGPELTGPGETETSQDGRSTLTLVQDGPRGFWKEESWSSILGDK